MSANGLTLAASRNSSTVQVEENMSVVDDLRAILQRANHDLDAVHDFFEHSKIVWESFGLLVDKGHTVASRNRETGTPIDEVGLLRLAPQYTRNYLITFTFRQFVSSFEAFLFNVLHRLLLHNPWQFAKSQLEFEAVLRAGSRDEVISNIVLKQLNDLKYENVREWFVAVNKAVKLDCPSDEEIDLLAEIKAVRDILEHNSGVVNDIYLRKAGKQARYKAGDSVEITDSYHVESWRLIKKVVSNVSVAALARIAKPSESGNPSSNM
jgi:hypothetical protein